MATIVTYQCLYCKSEFQYRKDGKVHKFCSRSCMGKHNLHPRGGSKITRHNERIMELRRQGLSAYSIRDLIPGVSRATIDRRIRELAPESRVARVIPPPKLRVVKPKVERLKPVPAPAPKAVKSVSIRTIPSEIKSKANAFLIFRQRVASK